jgi:hypothetical protein
VLHIPRSHTIVHPWTVVCEIMMSEKRSKAYHEVRCLPRRRNHRIIIMIITVV